MMIGRRIRDYRKQAGMSQLELARALGYKTQQSVSMLESNSRKLDAETAVTIADTLHCTLDQLLRGGNA